MTSPGAGWRPTTLEEVETAIKNGLVEENHFLDLKRELTSAQSATKDIAKDIAAFAIDGGLILIGVDEGPPVTINPVRLSGLAERVEQIGLMSVSDPVAVTTRLLRTANDPEVGVVAVSVPASPRAPHMADGRYYARGDKTNYRLSDPEVFRFHQRRVETRSDLIADAEAVLEGTASERSLVAVVAEPLSSTTDFLEDLSAHPDWNAEVRSLVANAVTNRQHSYSPSLASPLRTQRRPNGVALTTSPEPIGSGNQWTAEVTFNEHGRIVLISERPTDIRRFTNVNPQPPDLKVILDSLIVGNVELVVRLLAQVAEKYAYYGAWQIAVVVTDLEGGTSIKAVDPWGDPGPIYTEATYSRATEATFVELDTEPDKVTARLVLRLLRSLGVHTHSDWQHLSPPA
ncbi:AlbA family DNA-binding domain-containing protein [Mycobacterium intracellulare]|uniref:ATP-binding protein n=1 Tax=Mycobacterium intracellulare subsp. chimaera TaxID=222805 RepID=A0A7U5RUX1_MYCIT|nr:ATP-binding protein [Mycobacterium intracellulare]ASL14717.1 Divergent AAA domain protein [Mycobacterium intracellulare subsp. chimaera]ASQ85928.1 ATP-binding protein [Mycobacterium intracellulare subsp. chimaera]MCF1812877.1 ATP-binding protein [Mycobacterium intracellulare subsp. intracellulare]MDM3928197.1 ATP-binding protein [Mycobacterium intracellulare subsp. chimaera]MDS0334163.1 ATP-binding protein [Mycobacterium intracellulare]